LFFKKQKIKYNFCKQLIFNRMNNLQNTIR
jgi:hypothetical protein